MSATDTVQAVYAAFRERDVQKVFALFSPEIEITQSRDIPWGGSYRGHAGAQEFFTKLASRIASSVDLERVIDAGEHVVAIGWTGGTVNATGATFRVPFAHVWQVRDRMVVRAQFLIDNPTMLAALAAPAGPQPPPQ